MSVVVFDGEDLAGDSYLSIAGAMAQIEKVGRVGRFSYGFVGQPGIAQEAIRQYRDALIAGGDHESAVGGFNRWAGEAPLAQQAEAIVLIVPDRANNIHLWIAGDYMFSLKRQALYIGADEGLPLFNQYLVAGGEWSAKECVEKCVAVSAASDSKFALPPVCVV